MWRGRLPVWRATRRSSESIIAMKRVNRPDSTLPGDCRSVRAVDKRATALALKDQTERLRGAGAELSQLRLEEPITSPSRKVRILQRWCKKNAGNRAVATH